MQTRKCAVFIAAVSLALASPMAVLAGMDMEHNHGSMQMEHDSMEYSGHMMGKVAYEEIVDSVKAVFSVLDIKAKMKEMGMKETHHIMATFKDAKSGKVLSEGDVKVKVVGPDKSEQVKDLMGMEGGFGADFFMPAKGKYGVMAKFKLADGKVRSAKFCYTVK